MVLWNKYKSDKQQITPISNGPRVKGAGPTYDLFEAPDGEDGCAATSFSSERFCKVRILASRSLIWDSKD